MTKTARRTKIQRAAAIHYLSRHLFLSLEEVMAKFAISEPTAYRYRRQALDEVRKAQKEKFDACKHKPHTCAATEVEASVDAPAEAPVESWGEALVEGTVEAPAEPIVITSVSVDNTLDQRAKTYGRFVDVAATTQLLFSYLENRLLAHGTFLEHDQMLSLQMICQKLARIVNGDPRYADNWVDIAGYATLVAERLAGKQPR